MSKIKLLLFSFISVGLLTGCFIYTNYTIYTCPPENYTRSPNIYKNPPHLWLNYSLDVRSFGPEVKDSSEIAFSKPWSIQSLRNPLLVFDLESPRMESRHYMQLDTVISLLKNIPGLRVDMCRNMYGLVEDKDMEDWDSQVQNWEGEYKENGDRVYREILDYFEKNGITILQQPDDLANLRRCWSLFPIEDSLTGDLEWVDWVQDRIRKKFPEKLIIRFEAWSSEYEQYGYADVGYQRCLLVFPVK